MQPRALHRAACRQPTVIAPSRRPARCRSSERPQITYLCTAKQRAVMRLRVWGAGASETPHPQHARTLKQTSHLQQLPARCGRPRHLGAPQRSCPDPVRSRSASRPSVGPEPAGAAALPRSPEISLKMPVSSLPFPSWDSRPLRISGKVKVGSRASKVTLGGSVPSWLTLGTDRAGPSWPAHSLRAKRVFW